ncbi:hypothetical protein KHM83_19355 [Fusibacter paucivorans]|uniref:DUF5671 domain-containing protein n=1 Tax=Fusibacter paucivorans TaxID=76009 RepID=A0ABS5PW33_9FIRM|nr:hypothetical protein [Fusibacter paucivorans]MBS7528829.1 hypothetical protein [Fusibacter paucivorans]
MENKIILFIELVSKIIVIIPALISTFSIIKPYGGIRKSNKISQRYQNRSFGKLLNSILISLSLTLVIFFLEINYLTRDVNGIADISQKKLFLILLLSTLITVALIKGLSVLNIDYKNRVKKWLVVLTLSFGSSTYLIISLNIYKANNTDQNLLIVFFTLIFILSAILMSTASVLFLNLIMRREYLKLEFKVYLNNGHFYNCDEIYEFKNHITLAVQSKDNKTNVYMEVPRNNIGSISIKSIAEIN